MNRPRILVAEPVGFSAHAKEILARAGELDLRACTTAEIAGAFENYDAVWIRLGHRITAEMLGSAPRSRILATPVTGLDHVDLDACNALGIRVISLRGEVDFLKEVRATAELTIALALALLRHVPAAAGSVLRGEWNRDAFRGHELFRKTAGIVGMGRLGSIVADYFRAFGMRVIGFDPREDFPEDCAQRVSSLDVLLSESDVVSLHVTYSPATHHLIGASEIARMKRSAVILNTSRGGVLDERALLAALKAGSLAGAALDVLEGEPDLAPKGELLAYAKSNDNLIVVPHIGGNTFESFEKTEVFLAGRVARALEVSE